MRVVLNGALSVSVEDEALFGGQSVPVSFVCKVEADTINFEADKVRMSFNVPVEMTVGEHEWSRALGEVLARALRPATGSLST